MQLASGACFWGLWGKGINERSGPRAVSERTLLVRLACTSGPCLHWITAPRAVSERTLLVRRDQRRPLPTPTGEVLAAADCNESRRRRLHRPSRRRSSRLRRSVSRCIEEVRDLRRSVT